MLEQHEDQAQSVKSSSSAESRAEKKCRVEAQNAQVQNSSSADQVQCTRAVIECKDRSAGYIKLVHQLDVGAARRSSAECEVECRSDHQRCTIYLAERPAEGPAGKSARAEELLQREERLALGAHLGRGRICMLVGHSSSLLQLKMVHLRKSA
ncbi:Thiamin diphosphate-binding protein [Dorcoceras hygrometricum]|uniref:Thiamin diphosphate-binding protein n=1 Tax=Dorcoceras hygrometricum TaxID=472368 RepID=A0A2Z7B408_9LAMI|nr:Thiamin diphosphate-binding protein [Dorcoceras hygrometricum]